MRPALRQVRNLLNHDPRHIQPSIPIYLCPTLLKASPRATTARVKSIQLHSFSTLGRARQQQALASTLSPETHGSQPPSSRSGVPHPARRTLPRACPGCGAPTQILDKNEAGFYNADRRVVKEYLEFDPNKKVEETEEGDIYTKALKQVDPKVLEDLGLGQEVLVAPKHVEKAPETPVCDRCHNLIHHHVGTPIHHPTVESIQQTISESPHRHNHIYHVIDAADFPLSIIPNLQSSLRIPKLRTQNRRAKHKGWVANDRIAEVSFIITRADLLAPKKEQVDKLMPYVQDVLRDALGRANKLARLGNVRLVSAKRGWWTKQIKEDIWDRGGGGWMVGKVNVGKSNLFEVVFPKGRGAEYENIRKVYNATEREEMLRNAKSQEEYDTIQKEFASAERQESLASLEAELGRLRKEVQDDLTKATIPKALSAAEREKMLNAAKSLEDLAQAQRQIAEEDAELERYKKGDNYVPKGRSASPTVHSATEREEMLRNAKSLEELSEIQKVFMEEDAVGERPKRLSELEAEIGRLKDASQSHIEKASEAEQSEEDEGFDPDALLPPPQPYTPYPVLPIASSLPGTTASPIRIPFGRNRGELIDLPGLARTSPGLETFVQAPEHDSLVMKHRINAPRLTLKPGQSLILGGGLIRITPVTEDLVFLIHPFVPIDPHVTRTDKAIDYQSQTSTRTLSTIVAPKTGSKMRSAGRFQLKWDVTKKLAGPLTSPVAAKMKPENLPFRVWSIDILIEGVGWVEVSAQTRRPQGWKPVGIVKKDPNHAKKEKLAARKKELEFKHRKYDALARAEKEGRDPQQVLMEEFAADREGDRMAEWEENYPEIEVFSPLGKFVGARRPMCASMVSGPKRISSRERTARPRRSMVSVKRQRLPKAKLAANAGSA